MDSDGEQFEGWRSPTVSDENSGAEPMSVDDAVKNITITIFTGPNRTQNKIKKIIFWLDVF